MYCKMIRTLNIQYWSKAEEEEEMTKRIIVPQYNLNEIPDYFKIHIGNKFALITMNKKNCFVD